MPGSTEALTRARVVSEMARKLDGRHPGPAAPDFTLSTGFDPDNEACTSTRQLDKGPASIQQLCDSAKKYRPGHGRPAPSNQRVATAVLAEAFPDFTDDFDFDAYADESMSVEIARGGPKHVRPASSSWHKRDASNTKSSVRAKAQAFDVHLSMLDDTPPVPAKNASPRRSSIEKQRALFERHNAPTAPKAPSQPRDLPPRKNSVEKQRALFERESANAAPPVARARIPVRPRTSLAQSHARVVDSEPALNANRPAPAPPAVRAKSSRFGNTRTAHSTANPTITLPDVSYLSELVSTVSPAEKDKENRDPKDATRPAKAASRFASAKASPTKDADKHAAVENAPLLSDEKAIVASIKGLEGRLASCETDNRRTRSPPPPGSRAC